MGDALSRRPHLNSLCELTTNWKELLLADYAKNQFAISIIEGAFHDEKYKVVDGLIHYKGRIFLIPESKLKKKILQTFHDIPLVGHQGYFKSYRQIRERFSWKGLKDDVLRYIKECHTCQMNKDEPTFPAGLLQPLPIPNQKWESISMKFIMGLPKAQGKDCIYVVVYRLTKFAHFFAITSSFSVAQVVDLFFHEVFRLHGLLKKIVSDRDSKLLSTLWLEVFKLSGTMLTPSISYHPQTDGQTEIVNKWLEGYLRNYFSKQQRAWVRWLHLGEYYYNSSFHMPIRMSPFMALYGYKAPSFVDLMFGDSKAPQVRDMLQQSQDILKSLKTNLHHAHNQ